MGSLDAEQAALLIISSICALVIVYFLIFALLLRITTRAPRINGRMEEEMPVDKKAKLIAYLIQHENDD